MKLEITPLNQKDPRWKSKKLGTSKVTIGSDGCAISVLAMLLTYYRHQITPEVLNDLLVANNGYANENLVRWEVIPNLFHDVFFDKRIDCPDEPAPLGTIDQYLTSEKPVIACVDYNPATAELDQHFVLIIGKDEQGSYLINDPMGGETYYLQAKYGEASKAIFGLRLYSGPIPSVPTSNAGSAVTIDAYKNFVQDLQTVLRAESFDFPILLGKAESDRIAAQEYKDFVEKVATLVSCAVTDPKAVLEAVKSLAYGKNNEILEIKKKKLCEFSKTDLLIGILYKLLSRQ
jgi:hypothetical protein